MIIDRTIKQRFIVLAIALIAIIVLAVIVQRQAASQASISPEYNSRIGEDGAPDSVSQLYLTNGDEFYSTFESSIQSSILDAIYAKNYEIYGTISRTAEMKGGIKTNKDRSQSFTLLMGEQRQPLDITVTVKNAATNDFTITIKKGTS